MRTHYWETRQSMTPQKALDFLKEGNERFLNNLRINRNFLQLVNETAENQFPFTAILSCSDSRISTELIFDQGLGDIFSIRLAGNVASINAIGSMEYACKILGSKLALVMGHTGCGAIKSACDGASLDNLNEVLSQIHPSINAENETTENRNSANKQFLNNVAKLNVVRNMNVIVQESAILSEMLGQGEINLLGAMYDVETGRVEFFCEDTHQAKAIENGVLKPAKKLNQEV
ncbi:MAG: carbonic anhydrase [Chitinophagaceae bacterium]|nr:carbonic anhydrase [Chitinophagaceae bacterium]